MDEFNTICDSLIKEYNKHFFEYIALTVRFLNYLIEVFKNIKDVKNVYYKSLCKYLSDVIKSLNANKMIISLPSFIENINDLKYKNNKTI